MEKWQICVLTVIAAVVLRVLEAIIKVLVTWQMLLSLCAVIIIFTVLFVLLRPFYQNWSSADNSQEVIEPNQSVTGNETKDDTQKDITATKKETTNAQSSPDANNGRSNDSVTDADEEDKSDTKFEKIEDDEIQEAIHYAQFKTEHEDPTQDTFMPKPLHLVSCSDDGVLSVVPQTLDKLREIITPMCVIAVVGKLRTGKSCLLNAFFNFDNTYGNDLKVTDSSDACTKGIWVWVRKHPQKKNRQIVVLDTEGLFDPQKRDDVNDRKLFSLATLLSSCLVFNIFRNIDEGMLHEFKLVTDLTKYIKNKTNETSQAFSHSQLVILIRDATLTYVRDGKLCTDDEYLEHTLEEHGRSDSDQTRAQIKKFFPRRTCLKICQPSQTGYFIQAYYNVTGKVSQFSKDMWNAVTRLYHLTQSFPNDTKPVVNGRAFANIVQTFVDCLNDANVSSTAIIEDISTVDLAADQYMSNMQTTIDTFYNSGTPISDDQLSKEHDQQVTVILDKHKYMKKKIILLLEFELKESFEQVKLRNSDLWRRFRTALLERMCYEFDCYIEGGGISAGYGKLKRRHLDKYFKLVGKTQASNDQLKLALVKYNLPGNRLFWRDSGVAGGGMSAAAGLGAYAGAGSGIALGPLGMAGGALVGGAIGAATAGSGMLIAYLASPRIEDVIDKGRKVIEEREKANETQQTAAT